MGIEKDLLLNITTENIKGKTLINTLLNIYLDELQRTLNVSRDLPQILDIDTVNETKEDVLNVYLNSVYNTFLDAFQDPEVSNANRQFFESLGQTYTQPNRSDIIDAFNQEHIITNKSYKQKKGTSAGIFYVYDLLRNSGLQQLDNAAFINILTGTETEPNAPFTFRVESTLTFETYNTVIRPLAHPLGFGFDYSRLLRLFLEDEFGIEIVRTNFQASITCPNGFSLTIQNITDIRTEFNAIGSATRTIVSISDGSRYEQGFDGIIRQYSSTDVLLETFSSTCTLQTSFDNVITITLTDVIEFTDEQGLEETYRVTHIIGDFNIGDGTVIGGEFVATDVIAFTDAQALTENAQILDNSGCTFAVITNANSVINSFNIGDGTLIGAPTTTSIDINT